MTSVDGAEQAAPRPACKNDESAGDILDDRLRGVAKALRKALEPADQDLPERVHKLRVATRRADAALRLLGGLARKSRRKRVRQQVRELRKAASALRACHVDARLLLDLRSQTPVEHQWALETAALLCSTDAHEAHRRLRDVAGRLERKDFEKSIGRLMQSWTKQSRRDVQQAAMRALFTEKMPALVQQMQSLVQESDTSFERLHQLRLLGKKVRYGLEIFESCVPAHTLAESLEVLRRLQDGLGAINDLTELQQRVFAFAEQAQGVIDGNVALAIGQSGDSAIEESGDTHHGDHGEHGEISQRVPSVSSRFPVAESAKSPNVPTGVVSESMFALARWIGHRCEIQRDAFVARWNSGERAYLEAALAIIQAASGGPSDADRVTRLSESAVQAPTAEPQAEEVTIYTHARVRHRVPAGELS